MSRLIRGFFPKGRAWRSIDTLVGWFEHIYYYLYSYIVFWWYVCEDSLIDKYKEDYSIPNGIFYPTDANEHKRDIFVLKHLMKGNTRWHFRAIANIYNIDIDFVSREEIETGFVYGFPLKFTDREHKLYIVYRLNNKCGFVYKFPFTFKCSRQLDKVKKIFDIIKEAQVEIVYIGKDDWEYPQRIENCLNYRKECR